MRPQNAGDVARAPLIASAVLACALASGAASAQPAADVAKARSLANEAVDLLDQKKYEGALDRLQRAEQLFHAPTHVAMLGEALEGLGRLAESLGVFEKLAAEKLAPSAPAAFRRAQQEAVEKVRALSARVPSVRVEVDGAPDGAATATLDGQAIGLGAAARVDPGHHTLHVEAAGFVAVDRPVMLPESGDVVTVALTLARVPAAAPAPPVVAPVEVPEERPSFWHSRVPAYAALGIGGAGLAVGAVTGGLSLAKVGDLKGRCPSGACPASAQPDIDKAGALGTASTVAFAVGAVAVAAGVVLLVVHRPAKKEPATTGLHVTATGFGGSF
jgi:hypothetical protein